MEVLADHVQTQLTTAEQIASDLLFPAADGGYLGEHCLRKPFAKVGALIGLEMSFTPCGLRRTFNDLARTARVEALVTKSISGHLTDRMREHDSTVHPVEQRDSIGAVLRLVEGGAVAGEPAASGTSGGTQGPVSGTFRGQSDRCDLANRAFSRCFLVGARGFEPPTPTVSRRIQAFLQDTGRYGLQEVALLGVTGASTPLRPSGMHRGMHPEMHTAPSKRYP